MDDKTVEHLRLIQNVVDRMARNSFQLKAWAVVLAAAIFALAANQADYRYFLIGLLPALTFWGLDGYYLRQERLFRKLYDKVRAGNHDVAQYGPFSMNTTPYEGEVAKWLEVCFSPTISWFYLPLAISVGIASGVTVAIG